MHARDDDDLTSAFEELIAFEARLHREEVHQLRKALATSRCIGMAIGILMSARHLTQDDAWALLVKTSRDRNRKVRDLADDVVQQGDLP